MKSLIVWYDIGKEGPAPHGAGGLKFEHINGAAGALIVPPRTGRVD